MKTFVPTRRVDAPVLSEEEVGRLIEGKYVEGEFGLEEGDMFLLGDREVLCYRTMEGGRERLRVVG